MFWIAVGTAIVSLVVAAAAFAGGNPYPAPAPTPICQPVALPLTVTYPGFEEFSGGSRTINNQSTIDSISSDGGGLFYVGYDTENQGTFVEWAFGPGDNPQVIFNPGWNDYQLTSCGTYVPPPPKTKLCYSKWQVDPATYTYAEGAKNFKDGMTIPFAVKDGKSLTNIGNGYHLQCNLDPGMTVALDMVSGGGGETYEGAYALERLATQPLDYYPVAKAA